MSTNASAPTPEWNAITPEVNATAEFVEIANDFGNPLELLREAISNAIDAKATEIRICFEVKNVEGANALVIQIDDNGVGMPEEVISRDFWGLGFSTSRGDTSKIGEKGHGTKIYLRSETVRVLTQHATGTFEAVCDRPMRNLSRNLAHSPSYRRIPAFRAGTGTTLEIIGYNKSERSSFTQDVVRDYVQWFTKFGSIEMLFGKRDLSDTKLFIKCLDSAEFEPIPFGHPFPDESADIEKLFETYDVGASDRFVKRYVKENKRLERFPEVTFDAIISIEGDQVKREYNKQLRDRRRKDTGKYKVADRYGIYLCKDYMPIQRVNDWVSGFGGGSNAITMIHGFINCQGLKLTANRGTIANTDPEVIAELRASIQQWLDEIDGDLRSGSFYTLLDWQNEQRTLTQENTDFTARVERSKKRKSLNYKGVTAYEPRNEAELATLFTIFYSLHPELFEFEPLDYNTTKGIDVVARNKKGGGSESPYWYVELKYALKPVLNHGFKHLRWIVCWEFEKEITVDTEFTSIQERENDVRRLELGKDENDNSLYYLNSKSAAVKIQVLRLREFLKERLGIEFK